MYQRIVHKYNSHVYQCLINKGKEIILLGNFNVVMLCNVYEPKMNYGMYVILLLNLHALIKTSQE